MLSFKKMTRDFERHRNLLYLKLSPGSSGVPGGIPGGQLGGVIGGIISTSSNLATVPKLSKPAPTVQRVRVSQGVTKGMVVYWIEPTYDETGRLR